MEFKDDEDFRRNALYPCVRVKTAKAGGSGQVIHSSEENGTFVITCHHVVEDSIVVKEEWSNTLQCNVKKDVFAPVDIEFFNYSYHDRAIGSEQVRAKIICYDKNEDVSLLKLEDINRIRPACTLYPCFGLNDESIDEGIDYGSGVITVGAALGSAPVMTVGHLCGFGRMIDQREYWLSTAPSIFGNSGGATFLVDNYKLVGMPARISVTMAGFSADAITHMGYIVPITRITQFLKDSMMDFLFDDSVTFEQCEKKIKEKREKMELSMMVEAMKGSKG